MAGQRPHMDDAAMISPSMVEPALRNANRRLLDAIETPPETGVESTLDRFAAITWHYARETERRPSPGRLRQLVCQLSRLEPETEGRKRLLVRDARLDLQRASAGLEAV